MSSLAFPPALTRSLNTFGSACYYAYTTLEELLALFGQVVYAFSQIAVGKRRFRWNSFIRHLREAGLQAVPIIALTAFLLSIVLAYQSIQQLRVFGAQQFSINLLAISMLREMGGIIAAIIVAARSGSAFTSEIGVMKIREEIDALNVMGINPLDVLVIPRVAALIVALPLLTFITFIAGALGGTLIGITLLHFSPLQYLARFGDAVTFENFCIGMGKAPFFALLIGLISCTTGLKVSGSAESVGLETTRSVVQSIFAVLMADALFSIISFQMGW